MSFNIRPATLDDLDSVVDLWKQLSKDQLGKDEYYRGSMEFEGGNEQFTKSLTDDNCQIHLLETDDKVTGFVETWLYPSDFHFYVDDYAYILHYYIEPDARKGLENARMVRGLFKAAESWAKEQGRDYIVADVFYHNERVQKLLQFVGLEVYRTRLAKKISDEADLK